MTYLSAQVVRIGADSMSSKRVTLWGGVAGSGAFFSRYVLNLVAGHSFVEVRDVLEEFDDFL